MATNAPGRMIRGHSDRHSIFIRVEIKEPLLAF